MHLKFLGELTMSFITDNGSNMVRAFCLLEPDSPELTDFNDEDEL